MNKLFEDMLTHADEIGRLHQEIGRLNQRVASAVEGLRMIRDADVDNIKSPAYYLKGMASGVLMRLGEEDALGIDKEESDEA